MLEKVVYVHVASKFTGNQSQSVFATKVVIVR